MNRRVIGKCVYFITERRALKDRNGAKGGGPSTDGKGPGGYFK